MVKGYEYDEYGNTTDGGEESFINEVTFTGSVRDLGSGLQYMNARYAGTTPSIWWTRPGICR